MGNWWHCVLNLDDDTFAVTQNYAPKEHVHAIRRFLREKPEQVSGTDEDREVLANRFDKALAEYDSSLLSSDSAVKTAQASTVSFWNHFRTTGGACGNGDVKKEYAHHEEESPCQQKKADAADLGAADDEWLSMLMGGE